MKKVVAIILSLSFSFMMSGCRFCLKPTYWNGMTKQETEEFILGKLEERYGEEFEMLGMYPTISSGFMRTACSPKSDNELVFETELWLSGSFYDTYIQSIVRREMKSFIDAVLSEQCEKYAVEIEVEGLLYKYDSEIRSADEASIKTFTEALPENKSQIYIILNDVSRVNELETLISEFIDKFHKAYVYIWFYFVDNDVIDSCVKASTEGVASSKIMDEYTILLWGKGYPEIHYTFDGSRNELVLVYQNELIEKTNREEQNTSQNAKGNEN